MTTWYPVKGFEGRYEVSEDGQQVRSLPKETRFGRYGRKTEVRLMKLTPDGYFQLRTVSGVLKRIRKDAIIPVKNNDHD